uniref:Ornithine cyclodeaminase n=1 Tax=Amorphochlora amoebiformis TaxID=1561963 RepID=A0A7S0H4X0_9EUKA|mmetsp:Transcript_29537/g.47143  ORF Transcript_29537/g.47143 Transcript_29537/m.47143 type:complete len:242 (+) Transcript_29537:80-805(+)
MLARSTARIARTIATPSAVARRGLATVNPPKLFSYEEIKTGVKEKDAISSVEAAFGMLAKGKVDVPIPMHIGIEESPEAGPGDCHIKGGYIYGTKTWTVKLANVSFYKNLDKGLPPGSGIFVVIDATNGFPLAIFQENRYLTDLRTGAAGAVSVKHFAAKDHTKVCFLGTGMIAGAMARASSEVHGWTEANCFGLDEAQTQRFCDEMEAELKFPFKVCKSAEEAVGSSDVIFTQTPAAQYT